MSFADAFLGDLGKMAGGGSKVFSARYWGDIPAFFVEILGVHPHVYQADVLRAISRERRVAAYGPHSLGKSFLMAGSIIHFAMTREAAEIDWKLVSTASANRQLKNYLWPEVHRLARKIRWDLTGMKPWRLGHELLDMEIKLYHGRAFGAATEHEGLIEGAHATQMAYWFDESKHVSATVFDAAEGALAQSGVGGREAYALAVSTPGDCAGRFYDICRQAEGLDDWYVRPITLPEAVAAGQIAEPWAKQKKRLWGAKSAIYLNRVEGVFAPSGAERKVVPLVDVDRAIQRGYDLLDKLVPGTDVGEPGELDLAERWRRAALLLPGLDAVGVDVGKGGVGRDPATLARRSGKVVFPVQVLPASDDAEGEIMGWTQGIVAANPGCVAVVDAIGAGGVVSALRDRGVDVIGFVASHHSDARDRTGELGFVNMRSEMWWKARERLHDPATEDILPDDATLVRELTEPEYTVKAGGKILIESKEDVGKRLANAEDREDEGGSTNRADAVLQSWLSSGSTAGIGAPKVNRPRRIHAI